MNLTAAEIIDPDRRYLFAATAVLPDVESVFWIYVSNAALGTLYHHGPLHTPLAALLISLILVAFHREETSKVFGCSFLGYLLSLAGDSIVEYGGVMWLYPVVLDHYTYPLIDSQSVTPVLFLAVAFSAALLLRRRKLPSGERGKGGRDILPDG